MKWISMKDELPPIYVDVILCNKEKKVTIGYIDDFNEITDYYDEDLYNSNRSPDEYTHWMKMPSPP